MAFVTYILVVGYMLGLQDRFSPEILATTASSALTALLLEIMVSPNNIFVSNSVAGIQTGIFFFPASNASTDSCSGFDIRIRLFGSVSGLLTSFSDC
jgi:hypothetical protein